MDESTQAPRNYHTSVIYDDKAREFAMYLDGDLCGYAKTRDLADATLNQLVYEMKAHATLAASPVTIGEQIANETPGNLTQDEWINLVRRVASVVRAERNERAAAEQRGRVAGLIAARDAMCPDCRHGIPAVNGPRGWHHPVAGITTICRAGEIHALIAEEAAHV